MTRRQLTGALVLVLALVLGLAPAVSLARFTSSPARNGTFSTATLQPPTSVKGTGGTGASLGWTASTSTGATGYQLLRSATSGSGFAQVRTVTPIATVSTTDAPGNGIWYYVLRTYFQSWTSAASNEAMVAVGPQSTGFKDCASNAADTGGNGNGFETTPGNGCVQDGALATDANTGTATTNLCLDTTNDRHRYWGYVFGMPATVSSIDGITVRARMSTNTNTGTYGACVQLSWDGGATWTTHQPTTFATNALTNYTFGGATDKWGRTWTTGQLNATNFRVRIIDVSTAANKTFNLDWLGVSVNYTP
jgi:hypothetical protein